MSLPLTRRIAQTALLATAGAASVIGAAGSASAIDLPVGPDTSGLTNLDGEGTGETLDTAARDTTQLAGKTGGQTVEKAVPAAGETAGHAGKTLAPAAQDLAGDTANKGTGLVSDATKDGLPGGLPSLGGLPIG